MEATFVEVPIKDRPGALAKVAKVLGDHSVNVEGLTVADGAAQFLTTDAARAVRVLDAYHYEPSVRRAFAVALTNAPGELARLSEALAEAGVNIVGTFGVAGGGGGYLYVQVDDPEAAQPVLRRFHSLRV